MFSLTMKTDSILNCFGSTSTQASRRATAGSRSKQDNRTFHIFAAALFCAVAPLELSHLIAIVVGAVCYFLLETLSPRVQQPLAKPKQEKESAARPIERAPARVKTHDRLQVANASASSAPRPSVAPVAAPTFDSTGFQAEVNEMLNQIVMTKESDQVLAQLSRRVTTVINRAIPEAEVSAYASGNFLNGAAFGVAVPEVDVVININPVVLQRRFQERWSNTQNVQKHVDLRKLMKSAIRACTDQLVATGVFKFRRSGFRGSEPRVTLLARLSNAKGDVNVPLTISVNALTPMHSAALITECGQKDLRAKHLILLVRRWAKDRGISHVAQGHLSPYAWTLMTMFFLQTHEAHGAALLPGLKEFEASGELVHSRKQTASAHSTQQSCQAERNCQSVADLFKAFISFYANTFDWKKEGVSVRSARRDSPDVSVPLHIIVHDAGKSSSVGPSIEDPFEVGMNLADVMTESSLARLHAELGRAHQMCGREDSLTLLLEPWVPPEATAAASNK